MRKRACLVALLTLASSHLTPAAAHAAPAVPAVVEGVLGGAAPEMLSLYAWPATHGMEVGDTADLVPLGGAPLGRGGAFQVDLEPTSALQSLAARNGGYVNFELRGPADVPLAHFFRYLVPGSATWRSGPDEPALPLAAKVPNGYPSHGQGTCGSMKLVEKKIAITQIGELRSEEDTRSAHFAYGKRADSSISTGVSRSGANWSASGEHKTANMAQDEVGWEVAHGRHVALDTAFYYGRYRCSMGAPWETVKAIGWKGDTALERPLEPRGCGAATEEEMSKQGPNTDFHRSSEKAASITRAATAFGFTFGSQSGYSEWVKADWFFGPAPMHYICGDGAVPAEAPRIFAGMGNSTGPACRPGRPC